MALGSAPVKWYWPQRGRSIPSQHDRHCPQSYNGSGFRGFRGSGLERGTWSLCRCSNERAMVISGISNNHYTFGPDVTLRNLASAATLSSPTEV